MQGVKRSMSLRADRLQLLYDVARSITTFTDLDPLLRFATRRVRELLEAEGCAVLLLDEERRRLFFPVASQATSRHSTGEVLAEISFPAHVGVAGWVLQQDRPALVEDAPSDARFYLGIDQATGITTRSILCAPLRIRAGSIGVIEVINPMRDRFSADDLTFLEVIAADIAVACEKARLYDRVRREAVGLRQVCRLAGFALMAAGVVVGLGTLRAGLAWALPLGEITTRPTTLVCGLLLAAGGALVAVARGWMVETTESTSVL